MMRRRHQKAIYALILSLITTTLLTSLLPLIKAQQEWTVTERGRNYILKQNTANPSLYSYESAPTWILNQTSNEYTPCIYWRNEAKKCYTIQTALIAGEIYDTGIAKYYNPTLTEERIKSETWQLWQWDGSSWKVGTLSATINFEVTQNTTGIYITATRATTKPNGELQIIYWFRIGKSLKHIIYWTSQETATQTVQIRQVWDVADSVTKCSIDNVLTSTTGTYDGTNFLFHNETNPLLILEDQTAMFEKLEPTNIDFAGKKVIYTFSNWTLAQNEKLEIDPATATLDNPTQDGTIEYYHNEETYTKYTTLTALMMGTELSGGSLWTYRSYSEWDITSIPDSALITKVEFRYHGALHNIDSDPYEMMGTRPSTSSAEAIYAEAGEGTSYASELGFPKEGELRDLGLGDNAESDLQAQLTANWFAIGLISTNEGTFTYSQIFSEEQGTANPPPTLYIEYYVPVFITLETNPAGLQVRLDEGTWYNSPHTFEIESGTTHSIECNGIQSGGTRTQYVWQSWNDTGANPHDVAPTANTTYVATYKTQYQVYVTSYPQGSGYVEFDGSPITTPWTSNWYDSGTNKTVEATDKTITANQERYVWDYWSDSEAKSHNITIDAGQYAAYFNHEWYFKVDSIYDDPTGEGWYVDGDSTVNSTVTTPVDGNETVGWTGTGSLTSGGTSGSNNTGTFTINEYSTCTWLWNVGPTFESFSASTSYIDPHEVFEISTVIADTTGNTDFVNATVAISNDVTLKWINSTNTFSIHYDPYSYATLHDSNKTILSSTSIELTWKISLGTSYPEGVVNVIEANTKVYDSIGLVGSGQYTGLFTFQKEGGFEPPSSSSTHSISDSLVERVVAPSVFGITDNMISVIILIGLGLGAVILWKKEHPTASKILIGGFVFLSLNFALAYILIPLELIPDFLSFIEPLGTQLVPSLQLSSFTVEEQSTIQIMFLLGLLAVAAVPLSMALTNQVET